MPFATFLLAASAALVVSLLLMRPIRRLAFQRGYVDRPDEKRRVHTRVTPNIGGLGIVAGIVVGGIILAIGHADASWLSPGVVGAVIGGLVLALTGFYDDIRGLGFKQKFFVQVVVAYLLLHAGFRFEVAGLPFVGTGVYDQALYSIPVTMLWIVGVINAVNLIDGIDGLASGVAAVALTALAVLFGVFGEPILAAVALVVAGAALGFLYHNKPPATIFMGDTGSLLLGYVLAVLPMAGTFHADPLLALAIPGLVLGLPILDTALTIFRRTVQRRAICAPDGQHIHHRLKRQHGDRRAVWTLYGVGTWFGVTAALVALAPAFWGYLVLAGTALMALGWAHSLGYINEHPRLRARRIQQLREARLDQSEHHGISNTRVSADMKTGDGAVQDVEHADLRSAWPDH
jgi:UDP-GlcNAc:undecaprenyl-phosphate GlcNAc-1-phosphate transferase